MEPLFAYLNIQLEILNKYLYTGIFQKVFLKIFVLITFFFRF